MPKRTAIHISRSTYYLHYNNKHMVCLFDDACCQYFLVRLLNCLSPYHVDLHAYCLLAQDIYLLVSADSLARVDRLWHSVACRYNNYFTERFGRCNLIMAKPVKSELVEDFKSVMGLQKRIERMPIEKNIVRNPGQHPWTSYCSNAFGSGDPRLRPHAAYQCYRQSGNHSLQHYRDFVAAPDDRDTGRALS